MRLFAGFILLIFIYVLIGIKGFKDGCREGEARVRERNRANSWSANSSVSHMQQHSPGGIKADTLEGDYDGSLNKEFEEK